MRPLHSLKLSPDDRDSLALWVATRVGLFLGAIYASWLLQPVTAQFHQWVDPTRPVLTPFYMWRQWDVYWYVGIAERGYGSEGLETAWAFFPGLPLLLRLGNSLQVPSIYVGLLISFLAGAAACLALSRLTRLAGGQGSRAALGWTVSPAAVFLFVPYTEALFCGLAFWAWLMARRSMWLWAGILAALATLVRVNGLFLTLALVVLLLTSQKREWRSALPLALPGLALVGYVFYGWRETGDWAAWLSSQAQGWDRAFAWPWLAAANTVSAVVDARSTAEGATLVFEVFGAVILVALTVWLLSTRKWAEATYVALTSLALLTNDVWYSVFRSTLVLFPLWVLLGLAMTRHRFLTVGYVAVSGPIMVVGAIGFTNTMWIG